ncbi:MAG: hypothetical protein ISS48_04290 [Candidatus Aenigmarchaeota archaeon]|nr:hypothetical protein [Candidatus Aenigmarchaeota archaeon]
MQRYSDAQGYDDMRAVLGEFQGFLDGLKSRATDSLTYLVARTTTMVFYYDWILQQRRKIILWEAEDRVLKS